MTKFGLYTKSPKIPFETHLYGLDEPIKKQLIDLREFVRDLGRNVIEEIRPHRIVYSKTITFRVFLDIKPTKEELIVSIRIDRKTPYTTYKVNHSLDLTDIKKEIESAYKNIS